MTNEGAWAVGSVCLAAFMSVIAMSVSYVKVHAPAPIVQELVLDDEVEMEIMITKELLRECLRFGYASERGKCIDGVFKVFDVDSDITGD